MGYYLKFNISSVMEYRMSFIIQCLGMALNNTAFIFFWWILFDNVKDIGGYGFPDVMLLWSIASTSFGLAFVMFGNAGEITRMIMNGELDTYLLQPKDPIVNIVCSKSSLSAWGDALYGIILFIAVQGFDPQGFLLFLLFSLTGALILTSLLVTIHSLSFYAGNVEGLASLVTEFLITFGIYPEGIFSGGLKYVLYTAIPVGFTAYVPAQVIKSFNPLLLLSVIGVTVLWICIAYWTFYTGLKKYESGNLIINKL